LLRCHTRYHAQTLLYALPIFEIGVRCTADAPRWEHDPNALAISCLGAVLLIKQPGIRDYHEALASALGVRLYWHQGFEDGCSGLDRKSTRLKSSHLVISYAVF